LLKRYLEYLGIEEGRVQFSWVSASEGERFAQVIEKVTEDVKALGPSRHLNINLSPAMKERMRESVS
jgi:coenzyme F420-reducing hydrogenase delta subunit